MKYVGSKRRIAKEVAPILQRLIDENDITTYIEPFCGGLNMMEKIRCRHRIGLDNEPYLIAMWNALLSGWKPPAHITEEEYNKVRENKSNYLDRYVGLVGYCCSFGAKFFGGYPRGRREDGTARDYYAEALRNIQKQLPDLQGVCLFCRDYKVLPLDEIGGGQVLFAVL